jgi:acyl carrier protein
MKDSVSSPSELQTGEPDPLALRVISIVAATLKIDRSRINVESRFEDLGSDSLDALNILFALEEEFDITIPDDSARGITTVRQLVDSLRPFVRDGGPAASRN